ncbi:hypothetical protein POP12_174 [Pectobacterium phage POP12]|nr:hypothetical protein POP12_174 [Pectobacterium phage POP12]
MKVYRVEFKASLIYENEMFEISKCTNIGPYGNGSDISCIAYCLDWFQENGLDYSCHMYRGSRANHPAPIKDRKLVESFCSFGKAERSILKGGYHYGFSSIEQLEKWFDVDDRFMLQGHGFCVMVYELPDNFAHVGDTQVMFALNESKLVDMMELYNDLSR